MYVCGTCEHRDAFPQSIVKLNSSSGNDQYTLIEHPTDLWTQWSNWLAQPRYTASIYQYQKVTGGVLLQHCTQSAKDPNFFKANMKHYSKEFQGSTFWQLQSSEVQCTWYAVSISKWCVVTIQYSTMIQLVLIISMILQSVVWATDKFVF